jgi:hypothetical protein
MNRKRANAGILRQAQNDRGRRAGGGVMQGFFDRLRMTEGTDILVESFCRTTGGDARATNRTVWTAKEPMQGFFGKLRMTEEGATAGPISGLRWSPSDS